jgi:hexosaminidase
MPEFDVPGHATAFLVAFPELASAPGPYELERNAGIFDPVLNPTIDTTYIFLDKLFEEMAGLFPDQYFHIGGDENNGNHWKENKEIQAFMQKNNLKTTLDLQTYFNNRLIKTVKRLNKKMMGWEEILQPGLSKDAIIHSWFGKESLYKAASQGYQTLLSNGFYIDLLQPASDHYLNDPLPEFKDWSKEEQKYPLTPEQEKLILGGEATMWSELVTPFTIDSRIWPRSAAIAERLWSPRSVKDVNDMYRRLDIVSFRLEELGLTHIKNKDVILRNLSNGYDIKALKTLANVAEPYKIYTRNRGGLMYKSYSPLTLFADATGADAPAARRFNLTVEKYILIPNPSELEEIKLVLNSWKVNHASFLSTLKESPVVGNLEKLSEKLSKLAAIGLEAVNTKNSTPEWYNKNSDYIKQIKNDVEAKRVNDQTFEDGRTSLAIVDAIQQLVDNTNKDLTIKRKAKEKEALDKKKAAETAH